MLSSSIDRRSNRSPGSASMLSRRVILVLMIGSLIALGVALLTFTSAL